MTDTTTNPASEPIEQEEEKSSGGMSWKRIATIAVVVMLALILLPIVIALLATQGQPLENFAAVIQVIRDLFIIFLALQGIMIILALAVLIAQVARLINLLQNEVQPILKNTQDTVNTAAGTVRFVGKNVTEPIVKVSGFLAGTSVILNNLFGIRRAIRPVEPKDKGEA
ncbi:MAG: hypothetical protein IT320_04495 [Anaerolineae bacterium]|nr:hypothetical protein [Anaerolineae bacterium]